MARYRYRPKERTELMILEAGESVDDNADTGQRSCL